MRTALLAGIAALVLAAPALAGDPALPRTDRATVRVIREAGLMGVWGTDCSAMASSTEWETIALSNKGVLTSEQGGDDIISSYLITDAVRLSPTEVRMKLTYLPEDGADAEGEDYTPENATTVVYRVEGDRQMTWQSTGPNGEPLITDGHFIDSEETSKWYLRCPKGIPVP